MLARAVNDYTQIALDKHADVPQRAMGMAHRKTNAERGPLGAWAYNTRDALDLSVEAVIDVLPTHYHPATLRKVEGGSSVPGRRMWRELANLYGRLADEKHVAIDAQPPLVEEVADGPPDLATALLAIAEELAAIREERAAWNRGFAAVFRAYADGQVSEELLDALAVLLPADAQR